MNRIVRQLTSLPRRLVILGVRAYQILISPWLGPNCRFVPSCSQYMIEAVARDGVLSGGYRGIRRILRCHPFHPGGYDPP